MRIVAVTMVRDEADIIGSTLRHLLAQGVDHILVADNRSVDDTPAICEALGVEVIEDPDVAYRQGSKMSRLAEQVAEPGDWVVPFDADEAWSNIAALWDLDADRAPRKPWVHVPTVKDPDHPDPFVRIGWRQEHTEKMPKVAFRWQPGAKIDMGNHGVAGVGGREAWDVLDIRHFQYRSLEQVRRKVTNGVEAYDAWGRDVTQGFGTHWRDLAERNDEQLADWWERYISQPLVYDPVYP